jgi:hypothetical protein
MRRDDLTRSTLRMLCELTQTRTNLGTSPLELSALMRDTTTGLDDSNLCCLERYRSTDRQPATRDHTSQTIALCGGPHRSYLSLRERSRALARG